MANVKMNKTLVATTQDNLIPPGWLVWWILAVVSRAGQRQEDVGADVDEYHKKLFFFKNCRNKHETYHLTSFRTNIHHEKQHSTLFISQLAEKTTTKNSFVSVLLCTFVCTLGFSEHQFNYALLL